MTHSRATDPFALDPLAPRPVRDVRAAHEADDDQVVLQWTPSEYRCVARTLTAVFHHCAEAEWPIPASLEAFSVWAATQGRQPRAPLDDPDNQTRIALTIARDIKTYLQMALFAAPGHPLRELATRALSETYDHLIARMGAQQDTPVAFLLTRGPESTDRPRESQMIVARVVLRLVVSDAMASLRFLERAEDFSILAERETPLADEWNAILAAAADADDLAAFEATQRVADDIIGTIEDATADDTERAPTPDDDHEAPPYALVHEHAVDGEAPTATHGEHVDDQDDGQDDGPDGDYDDDDAMWALGEMPPEHVLDVLCPLPFVQRMATTMETLWHVAFHDKWDPTDRAAVTRVIDILHDALEARTGAVDPRSQTRRAVAHRAERAAMIAAGFVLGEATDAAVSLPLTWPEALTVSLANLPDDDEDEEIPLMPLLLERRFAGSTQLAITAMWQGRGLQQPPEDRTTPATAKVVTTHQRSWTATAASFDDTPGDSDFRRAGAVLSRLLPTVPPEAVLHGMRVDHARRWTITLLAPEAWLLIAALDQQQTLSSRLTLGPRLLQMSAYGLRERLLDAVEATPGAVADARLIAHARTSQLPFVTLAILSFGQHRGSAHPLAHRAWAALDQPHFNPIVHGALVESRRELDTIATRDVPTGALLLAHRFLTPASLPDDAFARSLPYALLAERLPSLARGLTLTACAGLRAGGIFVSHDQFAMGVQLAFPFDRTVADDADDEREMKYDDHPWQPTIFFEPHQHDPSDDDEAFTAPRAPTFESSTDDEDDDHDANPVAAWHAAEHIPDAARPDYLVVSRTAEAWGEHLKVLTHAFDVRFNEDPEAGLCLVRCTFVLPADHPSLAQPDDDDHEPHRDGPVDGAPSDEATRAPAMPPLGAALALLDFVRETLDTMIPVVTTAIRRQHASSEVFDHPLSNPPSEPPTD